MEWYYSPSMLFRLLPSSALLCISTALIIVLTILYSQRRTRRLPPGPFSLPFIGHLHLLGKLPHQSLCELSKVHGPLMLLQLGSVPLLVASSPEMARQVLQVHDLTFADRTSTAVSKNIFGRGKDIAFSPPDAYWKLMRRLFAAEIVSPKGLHFFKPVRVEERRALMRSVLDDSADAKPQQMRQKLQGTMNDIIMRMMLGKRFAEFGGKLQDLQGSHKASNLVELIEETLELLGMINVGDFLPCLKWMDLQGCDRRSKKVAANLRAAFEGIINARRLANKDGHPPNDYLDVLLQASHSSDTPIHFMEVIVGYPNKFCKGSVEISGSSHDPPH